VRREYDAVALRMAANKYKNNRDVCAREVR
jgi:hypothetical protein